MEINFVDPYTKQCLKKNDKGNFYCQQSGKYSEYANYNGSYDFVHPNKERKYYDKFYDNSTGKISTDKLTLKYIDGEWHDDTKISNVILLDSLGELANKRVLILGNGISTKELYFLKSGANIVYTDLSITAVNLIKDRLSLSELKVYENNIEFHAVDALHLPFPDLSFDVIYGDGFVHHIEDEDLNQFFSDIYSQKKRDITGRSQGH